MGQTIKNHLLLSVCLPSLLWLQIWVNFDETLHSRYGREN